MGEGLGDVVVARVEEVGPIEGADRIRRVVVDDGSTSVEVVCGAGNFGVGDLVALAPVGAVLPGGFTIGKRKMKGVTSNGMLCSGRELRLSDDHAGILVLNDVDGAVPGAMLTDVLGIEPDVVFDVAVEANRPDAWCMAGVARDLAARLGLGFTIPSTGDLVARVDPGAVAPTPEVGPAVGTLASVRVDDTELCPRFTARVLTGVRVAESPGWLARRLVAAGMRPINNVVDASNYVMLELGQPTHPYDLDQLAGDGLVVRRAEAGETVTTLDGVERTLGRPGPGLGDTGQDCLICDATGSPLGIGGIMGGASSEIGATTTRVLLEAAYFVPMAIARTSKRLNLRTEASARFERGCDPAGIDRAAERFCELLALTGGPDLTLADGVLDVAARRAGAARGDRPPVAGQRPARHRTAGTGHRRAAAPARHGGHPDRRRRRPGRRGGADLPPRHPPRARSARPTWPRRWPAPTATPGCPAGTPPGPSPVGSPRTSAQRRRLKDVLCGLGACEAWTAAFVTEADQLAAGCAPPYVEVANPLVDAERYLRSSMAPGLVRAVLYNAERRQGDVRLFEVGSVFRIAEIPSGDGPTAEAVERLGAVFAGEGDDAWSAVAAWHTVADALGLAGWSMEQGPRDGDGPRVTHGYRSAALACVSAGWQWPPGRPRRGGRARPDLRRDLRPGGIRRPASPGGLARPRPRCPPRPATVVPRKPLESAPISRFPSSDIDLAFVVPEEVPAGSGGGHPVDGRGRAAGVGPAVRRLPGRVPREGDPQPRLPAAVLCPRPDAHRRGDRWAARRLHRRRRGRPPGLTALNVRAVGRSSDQVTSRSPSPTASRARSQRLRLPWWASARASDHRVRLIPIERTGSGGKGMGLDRTNRSRVRSRLDAGHQVEGDPGPEPGCPDAETRVAGQPRPPARRTSGRRTRRTVSRCRWPPTRSG